MKRYAYILAFIICALSLTGCAEETVISAGSGADIRQNDQQAQLSPDTAFISIPENTTGTDLEPQHETDPEPQQSVNEWEEWVCIAERPDDYEEKSTVTTVSSPQPAAENNAPIPADTASGASVNTTPSNLNDPTPTMTPTGGAYEFTIQNNTQYEWGYGLEPYFDKYDEEQGVWLPVEPITEIMVIEIYCILQPGGSSTYTLPIDRYYGELSTGSYRAGLLMRNHETETAEMIWCDFDLEVCY